MTEFTEEEMMHKIKIGCIIGFRCRMKAAADKAHRKKYKSYTTNILTRADAIETGIKELENGELKIDKLMIFSTSNSWVPFEKISYIEYNNDVYERVSDNKWTITSHIQN